uniref:MHC class I-like antigen recognition-like domain-containing protein n=1 Tax=Leptobrachium leishanense TaxID=445787 RepID=A0A8C5WCC0_9ANUR
MRGNMGLTPLLLFIMRLSEVYSGHSLQCYYTGVSVPGHGLPVFSAASYVDGIEITRYSSDNEGRVVPVAPWMQKVEDPDYWESQTQILKGTEPVYKHNVKTAMSRFNQTGGEKHTMYILTDTHNEGRAPCIRTGGGAHPVYALVGARTLYTHWWGRAPCIRTGGGAHPVYALVGVRTLYTHWWGCAPCIRTGGGAHPVYALVGVRTLYTHWWGCAPCIRTGGGAHPVYALVGVRTLYTHWWVVSARGKARIVFPPTRGHVKTRISFHVCEVVCTISMYL